MFQFLESIKQLAFTEPKQIKTRRTSLVSIGRDMPGLTPIGLTLIDDALGWESGDWALLAVESKR